MSQPFASYTPDRNHQAADSLSCDAFELYERDHGPGEILEGMRQAHPNYRFVLEPVGGHYPNELLCVEFPWATGTWYQVLEIGE